MSEHQRALLEKSATALQTANRNLDAGDADAATNRAYYACYYAASAALLGEGDRPRTHAGTHRQFNQRFVATGRIEVATGRTLAYAFQLRQRADYEALAVTDAAGVADLLADAERFVSEVGGARRRGLNGPGKSGHNPGKGLRNGAELCSGVDTRCVHTGP